MSRDALQVLIRSVDILCPAVSDRLDESVLNIVGRRVRLLANYGAGTDHIDLEAARRAGIMVSNTPDVLTEATAELALTLMLMVARRTSEGERELRSGRWSGWRPTHMMGTSLQGRTLGLVECGRIARALARMAVAAFGMTIVYHARRPAGDFEGAFVADLDTLLARANVVSLHCPGCLALGRPSESAGLVDQMARASIGRCDR